MIRISDAVMMAMYNAKADEQRRAGQDYTKLVPVPRTISAVCDLATNYKQYGLTQSEVLEVLKDIRK